MKSEKIYTIVKCAKDTSQAKNLEVLLKTEWPDFDLFSSQAEDIPDPVIATAGNDVIAGLAFTLYPEPLHDEELVWINALAVKQEYRGRGIASDLIKYAVEMMKEKGSQKWLYAYTDVSRLYASLGWTELSVECEADHKVMGFPLF